MQAEGIVIAVSLGIIVISLAVLAVVVVRYGKESVDNRHWEVEMWNICYGRRLDLQFDTQLVLGRELISAVFSGKSDITISREQCMLYENHDRIYVWNMSTVNPTVLNGQRVNLPQQLKPGDRLELGKSVFLITRVQLIQD